jgi:NAD(P)-dependent dehydrogenase (short-subunit alcohol dehydrogenase family)
VLGGGLLYDGRTIPQQEGLASEVASFGIRTTPVEPGFFRTELLSPQSTQYAEPSIQDYAERTIATVQAWQGMDGEQGGDPAKLAYDD